MTSAHQVQVVFLEEHFDDIFAKCLTDASVGIHPAVGNLVRITPEQVANQSGVWDIRRSHYIPYLFKIVQLRRQTPVHAEYFFIYQCRDWQIIE
jgi:hypothetical protein